MLIPPWLEPLITTAFFSVCRTHGDAARSECNMYCLDCNDQSFCFYCRSSKHKDHQVIQVGTLLIIFIYTGVAHFHQCVIYSS